MRFHRFATHHRILEASLLSRRRVAKPPGETSPFALPPLRLIHPSELPRLNRRKYYAPYFMASWHVDMNLKLAVFGINFSLCIDGKTRMVIWLKAQTNRFATSTYKLFNDACVREGGRPDAVITDHGSENVLMAHGVQLAHDSIPEGERVPSFHEQPHRAVSSVHNCRVERAWGDINPRITRCVLFFGYWLEHTYKFDSNDPTQLGSFHRVILPALDAWTQTYVDTRNHSIVRTSKHDPGCGGMPIRMKRQWPRPPDRHKPWPAYTVGAVLQSHFEGTGRDLSNNEEVSGVRDPTAYDPLSVLPEAAAVRDARLLAELPPVDRVTCLHKASAGTTDEERVHWMPLVRLMHLDMDLISAFYDASIFARQHEGVGGAEGGS